MTDAHAATRASEDSPRATFVAPVQTALPALAEVWLRNDLARLDGLAHDVTVTARTYAAAAGAGHDPALDATSAAMPGDLDAAHLMPLLPAMSLGEAPLLTQGAAERPSARGNGSELQVLQTLGQGGMGCVVLARQRSLQRDVAVKTLREGVGSGAMRDALISEAIVTGRLEHPGVVPVHALGRDDRGRPLMAMKRIEGVSWRHLIQKPDDRRWIDLVATHGDPIGAHIEIACSVCEALAFAHACGVVHRDVKPENVMFGALGEVYLVD